MSNKNIELTNITIDVVPAVKFNQFLNSGLNKSQCCQKIISPLMHKSLLENSRITVDRQGGRRYYGEWLVDLFNSVPISINRETKDLSSYNINHSEIRFQVKGDDKYLETALASIFSKYIRELMMICFNEYWHEQTSGIKKTAGYPQDGKRFINDLKEKHIAYDREKLIRKK
jgi:ribonuclease HII